MTHTLSAKQYLLPLAAPFFSRIHPLFLYTFVPHFSSHSSLIFLHIRVLVTAIHSAYASLAFFQWQRCVSSKDWRIFFYQIVHISACISCTEVIERSLDASWPTEDVCFARIVIGRATRATFVCSKKLGIFSFQNSSGDQNQHFAHGYPMRV